MKAKIQLPACYKKEAEAYIAKLEAESIARVHEEVMKERQDIALRSLYLCLLADTWAQVTLQNIGVDLAETGEQL